MRTFLLSSAAFFFLGGDANAQYYRGYYPQHRHYSGYGFGYGYSPYWRPPLALGVTIVRPTPVIAGPAIVAVPPIVTTSNYYSPVVAPVVANLPPLLPPQQIGTTLDQQRAAQVVTGWYNTFLHRQPDTAGLQNHVQVIATQGEDAALAGILGSDEYWQVTGQDARSWLVSLYVGVLNRQPREDEIQHWYQVLVSFGGDRQRTVLNFLPSARQEQRR